jgi:hypothetical protein
MIHSQPLHRPSSASASTIPGLGDATMVESVMHMHMHVHAGRILADGTLLMGPTSLRGNDFPGMPGGWLPARARQPRVVMQAASLGRWRPRVTHNQGLARVAGHAVTARAGRGLGPGSHPRFRPPRQRAEARIRGTRDSMIVSHFRCYHADYDSRSWKTVKSLGDMRYLRRSSPRPVSLQVATDLGHGTLGRPPRVPPACRTRRWLPCQDAGSALRNSVKRSPK